MIILDTNVISEMMKPDPAESVRRWLDDQLAEVLFLTSVSQAELLFGIAMLPAGRRKENLGAVLTGLEPLFAGRILPFDSDAAQHYAHSAVEVENSGRDFPTPNGYIAAIAASKGFAVATRDVAPFEAGGVAVINPWEAGE
ncbi:MAG: VapC toxin family PIN domain ribonuclease [Novosphingobium sp. 63-713]|uniref:type II toxin-antitoxin system VapC family toxin n=1 Tax=Novosphingobium sp. 63-713 TaxID=1895900 RepID=UPI00095D5A66|nr:type II toxin-antitoxin system VapC family toxin [Novosphingobium sp. 63-713]OJX91003.1 MAG: VapC toxin family PIN domain ribonuclease [Novosphingobium sp. 63-713]